MEGVHRVKSVKRSEDFQFDRFGLLGWGSNSGFQAVNLAIQFGASRILLCGFDMSIEKGLHWHGRHAAPLTNPTWSGLDKWRKQLDDQKPLLDQMGIEVINCSPHSRLKAYPRMELSRAVALPAPVLATPELKEA